MMSSANFWSRRGAIGAALALCLLLLVPGAVHAAKVRVLEAPFGSAAQPTFGQPANLLVDPGSGDVLVLDTGADTISRFASDGTPHAFSGLGTHVIDGAGGGNCPAVPADCDRTPEGSLAFGHPFAVASVIAIDSSDGPSAGNIYVVQSAGVGITMRSVTVFGPDGSYLGRVTKAGPADFQSTCGIAVDGDGEVYVGENEGQSIHQFAPSSSLLQSTDLVRTIKPPTEGHTWSDPCGLAAGAGPTDGTLYTMNPGNGGVVVRTNTDTGAFEGVLIPGFYDGPTGKAISVDPTSGHVFVAGATGIREIDDSGPTPVTLNTASGEFAGVASSGTANRIYVSRLGDPKVQIFSAPVPVPDVVTAPAEITGLTTATLKGTVNPDGAAVDDCHFEFGPTSSYGQIMPCAEGLPSIGSGTEPVPVTAEVAGLDAGGAVYHYRLVAGNPNGTVAGADQRLSTPDEPTIDETWALEVGTDYAKVRTIVNPRNDDTTLRIEYGPDSNYGSATGEIVVGSDDADHDFDVTLEELDPGTTYHYRVTATNVLGTVTTNDQVFRTFAEPAAPNTDCENQEFRTGHSAVLPDCRAFELVTPLDKKGGDVYSVFGNSADFEGGRPGAHYQSTDDGTKLTYTSYRAFGDSSSAPWNSQYLATRGATWESENLNAPRGPVLLLPGFNQETPYLGFEDDLCSGWLFQDTDRPFGLADNAGYPDLYRRHICSASTFDLISTAVPQNFAPYENTDATGVFPRLQFQGASEDGSRTVFTTPAKLTSNAPSSRSFDKIYISAEGSLRLVSMLPSAGGSSNGVPATAGARVGSLRINETINVRVFRENIKNAVSDDANTIYWHTFPGTGGPGPLYVSVNPDRGQSPVSGGVCTDLERACTLRVSGLVEPGVPGAFRGAKADGSQALFEMEDGTHANELYSYDLASRSVSPIATGVSGVLGSSDDLSRVFFTSKNVLAGAAVAGEDNLYLWEHGSGTTFIATLGEDDSNDDLLNTPYPGAERPANRTSRVTPDGKTVAFSSYSNLTGYDNRDVATGRLARETFIFDADSGELSCVSCPTTGTRPLARLFAPGFETSMADARFPGWGSSLYASRLLSDDGNRLFFETYARLAPTDTNGALDVYEWEAGGEGDCASSDPYFSAEANGCVRPISPGESPADSRFVDASADGDTVFLTTAQGLVSNDPGLYDIYNAQVGGGFDIEEAPPPCFEDTCQGPPSAPPGSPPTGTSTGGSGNQGRDRTPPAGRRCKKGRKLKKGKCVKKKPGKNKKRSGK